MRPPPRSPPRPMRARRSLLGRLILVVVLVLGDPLLLLRAPVCHLLELAGPAERTLLLVQLLHVVHLLQVLLLLLLLRDVVLRPDPGVVLLADLLPLLLAERLLLLPELLDLFVALVDAGPELAGHLPLERLDLPCSLLLCLHRLHL